MVERRGKRIASKAGTEKTKKKRKVNGKPESEISETSTAFSKFMSVVSDDLLLEIFTRLPDFRYAIQCKAVCKRWFSLISQPQFIRSFARHHKRRQYPQVLSKLLFNCFRRDFPKFHELSFEKPTSNLDAKPAPDGTCADLLRWSVDTLASLEDLVLLRRSPEDYYIYNWLTRQLVALPRCPTYRDNMCALVFESNNACEKSVPSVLPKMRFRVVLIWWSIFGPNGAPLFNASIYCSDTGKWTTQSINTTSFPCTIDRFHGQAVVSNGVAHWLLKEPEQRVQGVGALDPFKAADHPQRCRFIDMPTGFGRGWRSQAQYVRLGLVRGRLRMSQLFFRGKDSSYALKVWDLVDDDHDGQSPSWLLVHDVRVESDKTGCRRGCGGKSQVIAFHPENGDVVFLLHGFDIYRYEIRRNMCEKIWELPFPEDESQPSMFIKRILPRRLIVFPLVRPCLGPTQIPELSPI